jgi:secreted trypsin-like serine protease
LNFSASEIATIISISSYYIIHVICSVLQGDSGSPLVFLLNGVYNQVGIVSFGAAAGCQRGYPVAFTRVTSYLNWIASNTGISLQL